MAITPQKVMQINDGVFGGKLDSHVFYAQYLKYMKSEFIGKMITATIKNVPSFAGSGTAVYTKFYIPQLEKYADGSTPKRKIQSTRFDVSVNEFITCKWEWEDFDLNMIEASEFTAKASEGLAVATQAMWDAEATKLAYNTALTQKNYTKLATLSTTTDVSQMEMDNLTLVDSWTDLTTIFTRQMVGTSKEEIVSVMNEKGKYRRLKGLGVKGGDNITERYMNGSLTQVAGWNILSHPYVGKRVDKGTSWSLDQDYDFTKLECLTLNTEALCLPMGLNTIKDVRDPNSANDGIVAKMSYGKGVLYPELVKVFVNEYPTLEELNDAFKYIENRTDNKFASEGDARGAGYKLAGDSATVLNDIPETYSVGANPMSKLADAIEKMVSSPKESKVDTKKVESLEKEKAALLAENEKLQKAMADMLEATNKNTEQK